MARQRKPKADEQLNLLDITPDPTLETDWSQRFERPVQPPKPDPPATPSPAEVYRYLPRVKLPYFAVGERVLANVRGRRMIGKVTDIKNGFVFVRESSGLDSEPLPHLPEYLLKIPHQMRTLELPYEYQEPQPIDICHYCDRIIQIRSQDSDDGLITVIGFGCIEAAHRLLKYLREKGLMRLSNIHRQARYLNCPVEADVWGLPETPLHQLVERASCDRTARQKALEWQGFVPWPLDPGEQLDPFSRYKNWAICPEAPNGEIIAVDILHLESGERYTRCTEEEYDYWDDEGIVAMAQKAIDIAVGGTP